MILCGKNVLFITFFVLILASGCSKSEKSYTCCDPDSEKFVVSYGTSFGECIGYCNSSIAITQEKVTLTKSGWSDGIKTIISSKELETETWDSLLMLLQIEEVTNLPEIIGCPDCADGGAEWIEVLTADVNHKVVFEYHNEPAQLTEYVRLLRRISADIGQSIE